MRIMRIVCEIEPEELSNPEVQALVRQFTSTGDVSVVGVSENEVQWEVPSGGLPHELSRWADDSTTNLGQRSLVKEFLQGALERGDIRHDFGNSREARNGQSDYVMMRFTGRTDRGALAYVYPRSSRVELRLPGGAAEGHSHARALPRTAEGERYMVGVDLTDLDAVRDAVSLLGDAIDQLATWAG